MRFVVDPQADVTMLRFYSGEQKGATAFFRNRPLLRVLADLLADDPRPATSVLFHACSVGAEVYSLLVTAQLRGLNEGRRLDVTATDLNPEFLDYARAARYPAGAIASLTDEERAWFEDAGHGDIRPVAAIRERVRFLPPQSFVDARFEESFDWVFILNALTYVTPAQQASTIDAVARYDRRYLVLTAFHPDSIEADLTRNGKARSCGTSRRFTTAGATG